MTKTANQDLHESSQKARQSGHGGSCPRRAAELISSLRSRTNLNASELAELLQVSPSTITRIEKGQSCPSYDDMQVYLYRAGFKVVDGNLERLDHLRGYFSATEIGKVINRELEGGLNAEKLRVILRVVPKLVYDWKQLCEADLPKMMLPQPRVVKPEWQALLEGVVQFFAHSELLQDAPRWTHKTKLDKLFVPRAAVREIGRRWFERIAKRMALEFFDKNIIFSYDEMQLI